MHEPRPCLAKRSAELAQLKDRFERHELADLTLVSSVAWTYTASKTGGMDWGDPRLVWVIVSIVLVGREALPERYACGRCVGKQSAALAIAIVCATSSGRVGWIMGGSASGVHKQGTNGGKQAVGLIMRGVGFWPS